MGYSVLYIAFGIVALWLLSEVLLQYKARLRWRVLAFAGFMVLVLGVVERSVILVLLGAVAFGTGQTFVTLSYKRGFSTGWAIASRPGAGRGKAAGPEPVLEVGPIEADAAGQPDPEPSEQPARPEQLAGVGANPGEAYGFAGGQMPPGAPDGQIYQPMPILDDSGEYPLFDGRSSYTPDPYTSGGYEGYGAQGYESWNGYEQPQQAGWGQGDQQAAQYQQPGYGYQDGAFPAEPPAAGYSPAGSGQAGPGYDTGGYDFFGNASGNASGSGNGTGGGSDGAGTDYGVPGGDWQTPPPYPPQQPQAAPYGGYGYEQPQQAGWGQGGPQQQPYIPQQPTSPYEQAPQQSYAGEGAEYADPYDPYRY